MDPLKFAKSAGIWKRNLVMFRDPDRSCYHGNNIDIHAEIEWQRKYREDCTHVKELYCTGTSAGGYASILFGHHLRADEVFAFGAYTRIDLDSILNDPKMPNKSIDQNAFPEAHLDLAKLLSDWNGKTRYTLIYAEGCSTDREQAEHIAHCPGVTLHPVTGDNHNIFESVDPDVLLKSIFPPVRQRTEPL